MILSRKSSDFLLFIYSVGHTTVDKTRKAAVNMNYAIVLAGGTGKRLGAQMPKQFTEILGRPVLTYVLEVLEKAACVDGVCVVTVPTYRQAVQDWCAAYGYRKVRWITEGGTTCQASTYRGVQALEGIAQPKDVVAVCLSTGVFLTEEILADAVAAKYGNAMAVMPCIYNLAETVDGVRADAIHYKETHRTLNLPWTARYGLAQALYARAREDGVQMGETAYLPTLLLHYGYPLYLSRDTSLNKLHLTTPEDTEILTAILERRMK